MARQHYDPAAIEPKWQAFWDEQRSFRAIGPGEPGFDPSRPKCYILDMFPYPSGAGLHVGHPEGYTATDILARYRRQRGDNVLHPMGWDAFGLPAEQYAIQTGTHPAVTTRRNIENFKRQIRRLGFSYDWDRELDTTDPAYYRWTQWIFTRLFDEGLAYLAEVPVWWCEALGTVLANEEVLDGRSERGDHPCVRRPMKQWMLKITAYAERLLADLEPLDWPESIKAMQRQWIGRSEGAEVEFACADAPGGSIRVFTTRPDTLFGATYMVLAPEHPAVEALPSPAHAAKVRAYRDAAARKSELDRTDLAKEKTGVFTGAFAINPASGERIPIWVADYVVMGYGTGAIMAVPAHDLRDWEFAWRFGLLVRDVVAPPPGYEPIAAEAALAREGPEGKSHPFVGEGTARNSGEFDGLSTPEFKRRVTAWLAQRGLGEAKVTYRLRDWLFSRQRYWGEPFPILHRPDGSVARVPDSHLPITLPPMQDFQPTGRAEPPLAKAKEWVHAPAPSRRETNTMPQWAGSCWYYLRFLDPHNDAAPWDRAKERYWMPVDLYVGGAEHAVLHLLYARFWHKVLFDLGLVSTVEPFAKLYNQGMILSHAYRDARGAMVPADEAEEGGGGYRRKGSGEPLERIVAKMSKSLRNVETPDPVVEEYGADTFRLYEMFLGPLDAAKPWNPGDIPGVQRFLQRVWRLVVPEHADDGALHAHMADAARAGDADLERALDRAIRKVTEDLERMAFNTAISAMMVFVNEATKAGQGLARGQMERFLQLLNPFAPHLAEELWERLGNDPRRRPLVREPWPVWDASLLREASIELAVQVNGKVRGRVSVAADASRDAILAAARHSVREHLAGKQTVKEITVPGRLVNFVVKG
ncbi:MAG: leucine--tRNA ligase [Planctomycetaceae bacterium]